MADSVDGLRVVDSVVAGFALPASSAMMPSRLDPERAGLICERCEV